MKKIHNLAMLETDLETRNFSSIFTPSAKATHEENEAARAKHDSSESAAKEAYKAKQAEHINQSYASDLLNFQAEFRKSRNQANQSQTMRRNAEINAAFKSVSSKRVLEEVALKMDIDPRALV